MNDHADLSGLSIDGLIRWIGDSRTSKPDTRLAELLGNYAIDAARLVDVICIDLMQRRRMGQSVMVEDYLADFPAIAAESHLLDVIDAELCIAIELQQEILIESYQQRFPNLALQIRELLDLNQRSPESFVSNDEAVDLSYDTPDLSSKAIAIPSFPAPDWFVGQRYMSGGRGGEGKPAHWLISGTDRASGNRLAMKIVELPALWSSSMTQSLLDICESASTVNHPVWVRPFVATIQNGYLQVIRPWVYATSFADQMHHLNTVDWNLPLNETGGRGNQLRKLATIAFTLAAAHRVGATHGATHLENIFVDHLGELKLVDAACGRRTVIRWFDRARARVADDSSGAATFEERRASDANDLLELLATLIVGRRSSVSDDWPIVQQIISRVQQSASDDPEQPCAAIGVTLMRLADGIESPRPIRNGRRPYRLGFLNRLFPN